MRTIKFEKMLTDLKKTIDRKEIDLLPPYVFSGEVKVIEEARQVGEAADFLSRHACLGFDTETRPAFRKGEIYEPKEHYAKAETDGRSLVVCHTSPDPADRFLDLSNIQVFIYQLYRLGLYESHIQFCVF